MHKEQNGIYNKSGLEVVAIKSYEKDKKKRPWFSVNNDIKGIGNDVDQTQTTFLLVNLVH